jgi:hypothetical protein
MVPVAVFAPSVTVYVNVPVLSLLQSIAPGVIVIFVGSDVSTVTLKDGAVTPGANVMAPSDWIVTGSSSPSEAPLWLGADEPIKLTVVGPLLPQETVWSGAVGGLSVTPNVTLPWPGNVPSDTVYAITTVPTKKGAGVNVTLVVSNTTDPSSAGTEAAVTVTGDPSGALAGGTIGIRSAP